MLLLGISDGNFVQSYSWIGQVASAWFKDKEKNGQIDRQHLICIMVKIEKRYLKWAHYIRKYLGLLGNNGRENRT